MSSVEVLTNNPAKCAGLAAYGVRITGRVPLPPTPTPENLRYLRTKRARLGHLLLDLGCRVVGSDLVLNQDIEELRARGAEIFIRHRAEQVTASAPMLVVYSSAIRSGNPGRNLQTSVLKSLYERVR